MTVRIGLIGAGRAGMIHGRNFAFQVSGSQVIAVCDSDEDLCNAAKAELGLLDVFTDYRKLVVLSQIDAVVIATPTRLHQEIAVAAAQCGKHIFCEKPMAMTAEECDKINSAAAAAKVKLQIGFMRRFAPAFQDLRRRIDGGEIGDVVSVRSITYGPSHPQPWMYDLRMSNGPLAEVNSHDIDTVRWLTGSEITEVYAIAGNFRSLQARHEFPDYYDNVLMIAKLANGMQGLISGAQGVGYGYDARCEVLGTKGIAFAGGLAALPVACCNEFGLVSPVVKSWRELFAEAYRAEDQEFIRCILADKPPGVTGEDGKRAVQVVNAGNESILSGLPIKLS
jgi:predicted dehydrogenase